jgi:hypothetical protein
VAISQLFHYSIAFRAGVRYIESNLARTPFASPCVNFGFENSQQPIPGDFAFVVIESRSCFCFLLAEEWSETL